MDAFVNPFLIAPLAAGLASLALLPLLIRSRLLPSDRPNERSLHSAPVPRSGGIAILLPALLAGSIAAPALRLPLALAAGLAIVSFLDDRRPMPAALRLAAHALAAAVFVFASPGLSGLPLAGALVLALAIVWMTNLYNFMDGSDGLAGGMAAFGFGCYALLAAMAGLPGMAAACAAICACALAFLWFNFHPARIFMGDAGSVPLGFLAAAFGTAGWRDGAWPAVTPLVVFSPFIVDATLTLARRIANAERVWLPHRNHYYQRLVRMGLGHRRTALAEYTLMAAAAGSALALPRLPVALQPAVPAAWAAIYIALALAIDRRWRTYQEGHHDPA